MKTVPAAQIPDATAGEFRSKKVLLNFTPTEMEEVAEFVRDLSERGKMPTATLLREMILKAVRATKDAESNRSSSSPTS